MHTLRTPADRSNHVQPKLVGLACRMLVSWASASSRRRSSAIRARPTKSDNKVVLASVRELADKQGLSQAAREV